MPSVPSSVPIWTRRTCSGSRWIRWPSSACCGGAVFHVHLKDTKPEPERLAIAGVLDQRLGTSYPDRAWNFRTLGVGHDRDFWEAFVQSLQAVGFDGVLSIENEDPYMEGEEGVRQAAAFIAAAPGRARTWHDDRFARQGSRSHRLRQHRDGTSRGLGCASRRDSSPVAVADPTPERLELGRATAGLAPSDAYADYRDVIARDDVGVVDVCVPPHVRREIVIAAARAGKHILSEKPLATVPADAAAMVDEARKAGVTLGLVHNYLFQPEIILARELIRSGALGQVEIVILNYLGVEDYSRKCRVRPDVAARPRPVRRGHLHRHHPPGISRRGVARPPLSSGCRRMRTPGRWARAWRTSSRAASRRPDSTALINVGWSSGPDGIDGPGGIEVSGTDGRLAITYENGGTFAPFRELRLTDRAGTRVVETTATAPQGTVPLAVQEFAGAVAGDRAPAAPGEDGQRTLEAVMAAYESAALGRTVALPLEPGDPLFLRGAIGLRELELPDWSPVRRKGIFGVAAVT